MLLIVCLGSMFFVGLTSCKPLYIFYFLQFWHVYKEEENTIGLENAWNTIDDTLKQVIVNNFYFIFWGAFPFFIVES